jgi:hypothetical protein
MKELGDAKKERSFQDAFEIIGADDAGERGPIFLFYWGVEKQ